MPSIYEFAHKELHAEGINVNSLETIFYRTALESIVANQIVPFPIELLKKLTKQDRAWDNQPWPPELNAERAQCLSDCGFIAMINKDCSWLEQLDKLWVEPKVDYEWHMMSRGQIGLALHLNGLQSEFWSENSEYWFLENETFPRDTSNGYAWIALSKGDFSGAKIAISNFRLEMEHWRKSLNELEGNAVRRILMLPGKMLFLELRALETLVLD